MAELDSIVSVSISADSRTVSRQGFGTPLVLGHHTRFVDRYRAYSAPSEMVADGFTVYDDVYKMVAGIFAQDPSPEQVIVGRLPSAPAYSSRLEMTSATEGAYIRLSYLEPQCGTEVDVSRLIPGSSSLGAEATAVAALINDVDVDAIKTNVASSGSIQSLVAADFDGAVGAAAFASPRRVTFTASSHADWDATTVVITGKGPTGAVQAENLSLPNGGNTTLTTTSLFTQVTAVTIPAQSGTGGTATIGYRSGVTATVASTKYIDLTPLTAGRRVHAYDLENCTIEELTADAAYDTELSALQLENDDWYFILIDTASPANVSDVAAWALTAKKLFFYDTNSAAALAGTPPFDASSNKRAIGLFSRNSQEFNSARWVSTGATQTPGEATWAFKALAGATDHNLSTTAKNFLEGDNINHHMTVAGLSVTRQGVVGTGEFIDVVHGMDALEADIKETTFALLASSPKIPFTTKGLQVIRTGILAALRRFEESEDGSRTGLLAFGSSSVIMPTVASISSANKAARRLTGVRFSATLAGAVHFVEIEGTLST